MPAALTVPASIEEIIQRFDASSESIEEIVVGETVNKARKALDKPSKEESLGAWSEALAFGLSSNNSNNDPWGSHFGPMGSMVDKEGKTHYFPDIAGTPPQTVDHWMERALELKNPVLIARYADLAWEFAAAIGQRKREPEMARMAIDSYLKSTSGTYRSQDYYRYKALERALELAIRLKDDARVDGVRGEFMRLHRESMKDDQKQWWRAFDGLLTKKKARLTDDERAELIADAEAIVKLRSDTFSNSFDPHITENAAQRLIKVYAREHRGGDIARLYLVIAKSFEHFAGLGNAMLASALLQTSMNAYARAGQPGEAKRIRIEMQKKIGELRDEMKSIGTDITIKKDDVETFLEQLIVDDLGQTFIKMAAEFLPKRKTLEQSVKKMAEEAPLMAHIAQHVMSDDRVVAIIGSVDEDLFGRLFQQAKLTYNFSHIWLREAFSRLFEKHDVLPEHFVSWANRHGIFADMSLLLEGMRAFFAGDPVKAAHVLIPQVESALRTIAGQLGKPVTKAHPKVKGASVVINMGDILYDDAITSQIGDDLTFYFLSLYADPRGYNLRNELAHGELDIHSMSDHLSRLLVHTLLVLGVWKEFAASFAQDNPRENIGA